MGITIPESLHHDEAFPLNYLEKMRHIHKPLLAIHGAMDSIIPVTNGKELYQVCASKDKPLVIIDRAGHNNLLLIGPDKYFETIEWFIEEHLR